LWDVEITRDAVRVLVDRPGGIDLDALAGVAGTVVSPILDEHPDLTPEGRFDLEVSSPGIERTLRRPEQYGRYIGSLVSVKTGVAVAGSRRHQGTLLSADSEGIVLAPEGARDDQTLAIGYGDIERARTVLVWGASPKGSPTSGSPGSKSKQKAVKRPAATGSDAGSPVASTEKDIRP
jgi:ribosome maturation factor RimP